MKNDLFDSVDNYETCVSKIEVQAAESEGGNSDAAEGLALARKKKRYRHPG